MNFKVPPWEHQLEAISRAEMIADYGLFWEPGTGKTAATVHMLRSKYNAARRLLRTVIFCPPIVVRNWKDELLRHSALTPDKIVMLTGSGKQRLALFEKWKDGGRIFVTNYESLQMGELFEALEAWVPEALVFDESHKCKDGTAKRTKKAMQLSTVKVDRKTGVILKPAPLHRYILSGSPVLNSPLDIFCQFVLLDGGETFGLNFYAFRARYFRDANAGMPKGRYFPNWEILPGSIEDINSKVFNKAMRVLKKNCLDLPPMVTTQIKVGMTAAQAQHYKEMKDEYITFIESEEGQKPVAATLAITKALRLMQMTSGYVKTVDGEEIAIEKTPKEEALRELLAELTPNHKVIVWAVWKENYATIRKACKDLGIEYVELTGDTPEQKRFTNQDLFNQDPKVRVLIGHPGSGGIGINLIASDVSIFYSRNFSLEQSIQAEARNYRGGSEIHEKVTRYDLVCEGTIDELVVEKLASKTEISDRVLRDLSLELKKQ